MPGVIEAHAHISAGGIWRYVCCGHYARRDPQGETWAGVGSAAAVVQRLRGAADGIEGPVVGWGFEPKIPRKSPGNKPDPGPFLVGGSIPNGK